jgi:hypothetical protein
MGLLDDLDARRERAQQDRENSGRLAQSYADFDSTGQGTFEFDERIDFGIVFVEKPYFSYACVADMEALQDLLNRDPVPVPHCTGYVTEWDLDEHEMYAGCWVAVRVDFPLMEMIDYGIPVVVTHHLTFAGVALKDIRTNLST